MLWLLLDEHISPVVADGLTARRRDIRIVSLHHWRGGGLLGKSDRLVLQAAAEEGLTLVTYDLRTIPQLLTEWRALGLSHAGVLYVNRRTIHPHDFGGLIRALEALWEREHTATWTNRIQFLRVP